MHLIEQDHGLKINDVISMYNLCCDYTQFMLAVSIMNPKRGWMHGVMVCTLRSLAVFRIWLSIDHFDMWYLALPVRDTRNVALLLYLCTIDDMYNIPKVVECTRQLKEWVYSGDHQRLLDTPPRDLPEFVRRFTQDIYMCVYINPDAVLYGWYYIWLPACLISVYSRSSCKLACICELLYPACVISSLPVTHGSNCRLLNAYVLCHAPWSTSHFVHTFFIIT